MVCLYAFYSYYFNGVTLLILPGLLLESILTDVNLYPSGHKILRECDKPGDRPALSNHILVVHMDAIVCSIHIIAIRHGRHAPVPAIALVWVIRPTWHGKSSAIYI